MSFLRAKASSLSEESPCSSVIENGGGGGTNFSGAGAADASAPPDDSGGSWDEGSVVGGSVIMKVARKRDWAGGLKPPKEIVRYPRQSFTIVSACRRNRSTPSLFQMTCLALLIFSVRSICERIISSAWASERPGRPSNRWDWIAGEQATTTTQSHRVSPFVS